jgi:hypothetical protein
VVVVVALVVSVVLVVVVAVVAEEVPVGKSPETSAAPSPLETPPGGHTKL